MTVDVRGMPELVAALRAELARLVVAAAQDEPPDVARRLRRIAAAFGAGAAPEDLDAV
jgi:hypothetical protein